jgi:hypothetical protein
MSASTDRSTDEMVITRHARTLEVRVNQIDVEKSLGKKFISTDIFNIISETKEGIAATENDFTGYPTVHTLVIQSTGNQAIWTESSLSYINKAATPLSISVLFNCRGKQ